MSSEGRTVLAFLGLYVHVCKMGTLREAYQMARSNDGRRALTGHVEAIEESGAESFLVQIRDELVANTYRPMQARKKEIPKDGARKSASFRSLQFVIEWSREC